MKTGRLTCFLSVSLWFCTLSVSSWTHLTGLSAQEPAPPTSEPAVEPTTEPTQEPTSEPAQEPAEVPSAEPVQESAEEPAVEPAQEPAPQLPDPTHPIDFPMNSTPSHGVLALSPEEVEAIRTKFETDSKRFREIFKRLYVVQHEFRFSVTRDQTASIQTEWTNLRAEGEKLLIEMQDMAVLLYRSQPDRNSVGYRLILSAIFEDAERGHCWTAYRNILLLRQTVGINDAIRPIAAVLAFRCNQFDEFRQYIETANPAEFDEKHREAMMMYDVVAAGWAREMNFRRAEAQADDLPRVRFTMSTGVVEFELFANEAPNTVANFIELIDNGFYDGLSFHRVLLGFVAQGGCPNGDGSGGPEYFIPCECEKENARGHFLGSLSMAHAGKDTGGSQFFICYSAQPMLDGRHTVFGRVISGMEAAERLAPIDPEKLEGDEVPDTIIKAEVIRRRPGQTTVRKIEHHHDQPHN